MYAATGKKKRVKLPRTCFVIFRSAQNSDIRKNNPNMDFGDISKEIAKRWKNLSPEERGVWINKAKEEKARWEEEHGSVQEYKLQQQAAMDMPSVQDKKVQDMHSKYSAFAYFKRVFNKKVRLDIKQEGLRAQQHDAKIAASNAIAELVESFKNKPAPDNMDELKVNAAKVAVAKVIAEYKKKSKKEKFPSKDKLEQMAKARWIEMTAAEKAEFSDKSQKKIKELTTSVEKSKQRWSAADAIEDPLLGKYPMAHVLQLCHAVWKHVDEKTETNIAANENVEHIDWQKVSRILQTFPLRLRWAPHECQRVWKFVAYGDTSVDPRSPDYNNTTEILEDSDIEDIKESIGAGGFPQYQIQNRANSEARESVSNAKKQQQKLRAQLSRAEQKPKAKSPGITFTHVEVKSKQPKEDLKGDGVMDVTKEAAATAAPIANISGSSDNTLSSVENTDIMKSTAETEKEDWVSSNNEGVDSAGNSNKEARHAMETASSEVTANPNQGDSAVVNPKEQVACEVGKSDGQQVENKDESVPTQSDATETIEDGESDQSKKRRRSDSDEAVVEGDVQAKKIKTNDTTNQ